MKLIVCELRSRLLRRGHQDLGFGTFTRLKVGPLRGPTMSEAATRVGNVHTDRRRRRKVNACTLKRERYCSAGYCHRRSTALALWRVESGGSAERRGYRSLLPCRL